MRPVLQLAFALALTAGGAVDAATLWYNVNGYTSTADGIRSFSVMVVDDDGRIVAVGDDSLRDLHRDARAVDGGERTLLPGLTDAHAHLYGQGVLETQVDLAGAASLDEALERVRAYAAANPRKPWILGRGWNQVLWESRSFPTADDLDAVVDDRPVWLMRVDGHAAWANHRTLAIAGIDRETADPVGGKILRDANGEATGILIDTAMIYVDGHIPTPTKSDIRDAYRQAAELLIGLGLTGVHDAGITLEQAEVLMAMADDRELELRVSAMLAGAGENLDGFGEPLVGHGDDRLDVLAVKIYADGALGSRGAAMLAPYSDDPENRGLPFFNQAELNRQVLRANESGFQVAVHAIGDLGNRMVIEAFDETQQGKPSAFRNRIEHAQIVALDDIPRFAELGLIASMQPIHATSDMNMAEDRVGPVRIFGGYAWRKMLDSGAVVASGSDFPVELPNPFLGLYAAVTRMDRDGRPDGGWYADQAMTRAEALHSFTLAAAYAAHQEDRLGSLEPGKWADFIVIDRDYFTVPESEIDDIVVLETWIGGERVYARDDNGANGP